MQLQQGDVNIESVDVDVSELEKKGDNVVRHGESGHTHAIRGDATLYATEGGEIVADVGEGGAKLDHEEHDPVDLPEGQFKMWGTNEYDYSKQERREVID